MHWWWFTAGAICGGVVMTLVTFVFFAEQLGPWIKWKETVMQKELAISEELMEREKKRSEFRSEL
jgi:membrane protein YdbS with pleckstrin-like domain